MSFVGRFVLFRSVLIRDFTVGISCFLRIIKACWGSFSRELSSLSLFYDKEFANEESQRYKEGRVILERALITESEGFEDSGGE